MEHAGEKIKWNDYEYNISSSLNVLRNEQHFFDVTINCTDSCYGLKAHRLVLSACSPPLKAMLMEQGNHPNPVIYLRGFLVRDLSLILDFIYSGEVFVPQENRESFLAAAKELQIKDLANKHGERMGRAEVWETSTSGPPPKLSQDSSEVDKSDSDSEDQDHQDDQVDQGGEESDEVSLVFTYFRVRTNPL